MNPNTNTNSDAQSASSSQLPHLQRGKACLSCRRRKMKCDGARPVCTPCLRGERVEDCEYTDGQRRPRMLTLEDDIARLRARVQELEHPEEAPPSVELYTPYATAGPSSMGPTPTRSTGAAAVPLRMDSEAEVHARRALSVIAPYATELGVFLDLDRLRNQGSHVLPALQSTLTLWSVHITSTSEPNYAWAPERTYALTSHLLSQAQAQLASALSNLDAELEPAIILHVIQTGVLLAYYMQRVGQAVGARYYASGTCTLAMMVKLHLSPYPSMGAVEGQNRTSGGGRVREGSVHGNVDGCPFPFGACARLVPALDRIEAEERVCAFWAVYTLDRWFNGTGQGPSLLLAMDGSSTTTPWPDVGGVGQPRNVVQDLLRDADHDFLQDGPSALHAKAFVLLGEATSIAESYESDPTIGNRLPTFRTRFGTLNRLLQRCLNAAMTIATDRRTRSRAEAQALVAVHLIALANVTLYRAFISTHERSGRWCAEAAFAVVRLLDRTGERGVGAGVGSTSPVYAIVWTAACLALHNEVLRLRTRANADRREEGEMAGAIRKLVGRLSGLSQRHPGEFFAIKIEAVLPVLESISVQL